MEAAAFACSVEHTFGRTAGKSSPGLRKVSDVELTKGWKRRAVAGVFGQD